MIGEEPLAWARMYRVVHGWPMIGGLPAPLFLAMMAYAILGSFGASMISGLTAVGVVVLSVATSWLGLGWLFRQDQAALPLFFVKRRTRLKKIISSFNPSWIALVLAEED
jgi:hypothetical protein